MVRINLFLNSSDKVLTLTYDLETCFKVTAHPLYKDFLLVKWETDLANRKQYMGKDLYKKSALSLSSDTKNIVQGYYVPFPQGQSVGEV